MTLLIDAERILLAQKTVRAELLAERATGGYWTGHSGSSPLATAAAVSALVAAHHADSHNVLRDDAAAKAEQVADHVVRGDLCEFLLESVNWLAQHQNDDGGWGDCVSAESNLAATLMVQAAFRLTGIPAKYDDLILRADQYVAQQGGVSALRRQYREERPLIAAVLSNCALAGIVPWRHVPALPFELACVPSRWQRYAKLPVHRLELPLLLAVGRAKFYHDAPRNPLTRLWRRWVQNKALGQLERLQSSDDSFQASSLTTAIVVLSLASTGCQDHPVVTRGVEFLLASVRGDASWSVQSNLATTVTSLAIDALLPSMDLGTSWPGDAIETATDDHDPTATVPITLRSPQQPYETDMRADARGIDWLLECQLTERHALTEVAPGGWASSNARGAIPNALDTAGVLLALGDWVRQSGVMNRERVDQAAHLGLSWLLDLQNDDGGWATFAASPNDEHDASGPEVTARVLRAFAAWRGMRQRNGQTRTTAVTTTLLQRMDDASRRGWQYLENVQSEDGNFSARWFGNEHQADEQNLVLGTSEVLLASVESDRGEWEPAVRAAQWLVASQHAGGGWGPPRAPVNYSNADKEGFRAWRSNEAMSKECTIEETGAAVAALLPFAGSNPSISKAVTAGLNWLVNAVERDEHRGAAVIGFYPSRIWYHERLYPLVFAAGALERAVRHVAVRPPVAAPVG